MLALPSFPNLGTWGGKTSGWKERIREQQCSLMATSVHIPGSWRPGAPLLREWPLGTWRGVPRGTWGAPGENLQEAPGSGTPQHLAQARHSKSQARNPCPSRDGRSDSRAWAQSSQECTTRTPVPRPVPQCPCPIPPCPELPPQSPVSPVPCPIPPFPHPAVPMPGSSDEDLPWLPSSCPGSVPSSASQFAVTEPCPSGNRSCPGTAVRAEERFWARGKLEPSPCSPAVSQPGQGSRTGENGSAAGASPGKQRELWGGGSGQARPELQSPREETWD